MAFELVKITLKSEVEDNMEDNMEAASPKGAGYMYHRCTTCNIPAFYFSDFMFLTDPNNMFADPVRRAFNHVYCISCEDIRSMEGVELPSVDDGEVTVEEMSALSQIEASSDIKNKFLAAVSKKVFS